MRPALIPGACLCPFPAEVVRSRSRREAAARCCYAFIVDGVEIVDASEKGGPARFINHSCEPNAGIKEDVYLVAMRDIKKDEGVAFDYSMITADDWVLECACGTRSCRKLIGNYRDLPDSLKQKYKDYTPDWINHI